jgi:uncharacterized membrane protein YkoI
MFGNHTHGMIQKTDCGGNAMKDRKMIVVVLSLTILLLLTGGAFAAQSFTKQPARALNTQSVMDQTKPISQTVPSVSATPTTVVSSFIGEARAKEIALAHAGLKESEVNFVRVHLDYDNGRQEYEVEFYSDNVEYDYDIDALTGEIMSYDSDTEYYTSPHGNNTFPYAETIGIDRAKNIVLTHAGFTENEVYRLRVEFDYDDGRAEYDVEFNVGQIEYGYEIDAVNGNILSYEAEKDD